MDPITPTNTPPEKLWGMIDPIQNNVPGLIGAIVGVLVFSAVLFFALSLVPGRMRKPLIALITFLAGLFYALEFFWPVVPELAKGAAPLPKDVLQPGENFLTPYVKTIADISVVLQAFAIGLGVLSIVNLHFRNIVRRREGSFFSVVLLGAALAMTVVGIVQETSPDGSAWKTAHRFLYNGAFSNLNSAMFSIIAFYIVSAAYRAFRIRSVEATILLVSAALVMIGQVVVGQALTNWLPETGFAANFRTEVVADWIIKQVNSPAQLAINLGLGVGLLAASLRIWLSLERGSYFEKEL